MTNGELATLLEESAEQYCPQALESIVRNRHMNGLTDADIHLLSTLPGLSQRILEAVIVDFVNHIYAERGGDLGLHTHHLHE